MIPKKLSRDDLIGKRCRPVHEIRNGASDGITPDTIAIIRDVVRGHGFTIQTRPCPYCGQYTRISRIRREELELVKDKKPLEDIPSTAYIIQRDTEGNVVELEPVRMFVLLAKVGDYALVSDLYDQEKTAKELLRHHAEHTSKYRDTSVLVFPMEDCYASADDAWKALKKDCDAKRNEA